MRNIFSFLTSALVLLAVTVACHPSEITNPDNPDPKGKSEITITASIIQTRVSYDCSGLGEVKQHWEENDILFGFWGGSASNQIVFQVVKVDSGTGIATLKVLSPEKWIDTAADETKVDLVYTGDDDIANLPFSDSGISVNLSGQSLDRVPGCMHAQAALQEDEDGNKSLEFNFQNDCALIEIDGLTGFAESWPGGDATSLDLSSVSITNLLLGGSYSFSEGGVLVFEGNDESTVKTHEIALESGWAVRKDGDVSGPNGEKILIAVAPNPVEKEINVSAKKTSEMGTIQYPSYTYGKRSLAGGLCYVISAQPVVAKTADGQCFKSVSAAFAHAAVLSGQGYTTAEDNVVTLIKKEIKGFGEQTASLAHNEQIEIGYNVTLDLNGCSLELFGTETFTVQSNGEFTVTDFTKECSGDVWSESTMPVITNKGNVSILNIALLPDNVSVDNKSTGSLVIEGSIVQSYENTAIINAGTVTISNYSEIRGNGDYVIQNSGHCSLTINNSDVDPEEDNDCYATVYFENSDGASQAIFNMIGGQIGGGLNEDSSCDAIQLNGNVKATISGKVFSFSDNAVTLAPIKKKIEEKVVSVPAGELTITGGTITSTDGSAIVNYGDVTISGGTISSSYYTLDNYGDLEILGGTVYTDSDYGTIYGNEGSTTSLGSIENKDAPVIYSTATKLREGNDVITPVIWIEDGAGFSMEDGTVEARGKGAAIWLYCTDKECEISGGSISSIDSYAIDNGSDLTITGGTLTSTNSNAIYSGAGSVTIGTADGDDDDIIINSESNDSSKSYAAIYINDGTFTMYSGTVSGEGKWCALEINGINSTGSWTGSPSGEIFGGKLVSQQYHTLAVEYRGTCTVSGGELYCLGSTYSTINVKNGGLEIKWPKGTVFPTGYDSTSGEFPEGLPAEPLIFCCSTQFAPIEAPDIDMNNANQGEVKINGGYLFACNYSAASESSRDYYADDSRLTKTQTDPAYTDSVLKSCGHFFSTVYNLDYDSNVPYSIPQPYYFFVSGESPVDELIDSSWLPTKNGETAPYSWYYIY